MKIVNITNKEIKQMRKEMQMFDDDWIAAAGTSFADDVWRAQRKMFYELLDKLEKAEESEEQKMTKWKKVTPLPPEFNGYGYLFECTKCHKVVTYLGAKKLPPWECKCQKKTEKVEVSCNTCGNQGKEICHDCKVETYHGKKVSIPTHYQIPAEDETPEKPCCYCEFETTPVCKDCSKIPNSKGRTHFEFRQNISMSEMMEADI